MSGSGPDDLNEEPDINANPAIDPPTPQGFEEVFSLFQTYLETRLAFLTPNWKNWLLCWASFYNGLENIFHMCERSELK